MLRVPRRLGIDDDVPYPGPRSWHRWKAKRRLASFLYVSGITRSGGWSHSSGSDPVGGWVFGMPRLRDVLPRRGGTLRPYVLWRRSWWWKCHRAQGFHLRGRHRPCEPVCFDICAACVPCPYCGAAYCAPTCWTRTGGPEPMAADLAPFPRFNLRRARR